MATVVCFECKSEIPRGSELCPECGFHFESVNPVKCPECSQLVVFDSGVCPECGFPTEALNDLVLESEKLQQEETALGGQAQQLIDAAQAPSPGDGASQEPLAAPPVGDTAVEETLPVVPAPRNASPDLLMERINSYLEDVRAGHDNIMQELTQGVEKFLLSAGNVQVEIVNSVAEQNRSTLQGMQETAANFSSEMKTVVEGINAAKTQALTEIGAANTQAKSDILLTSTEIQDKVSGTVDYIFYLCLAMLLFTAVNIVVTAYVIKVVK